MLREQRGIVSCWSTLEWLRNQLGMYTSIEEIERIATSLSSKEGVYLVPAFSGMGAPYWQKDWKASIHGIDFGTSKKHLLRAALESIAYQLKDVTASIERETKYTLKELKVNGGMTANRFLMQFIANLLQTPILNIGITDVSGWGALMAGLGIKYWKSLKELPCPSSEKIKCYKPDGIGVTTENYYAEWTSILKNKKN